MWLIVSLSLLLASSSCTTDDASPSAGNNDDTPDRPAPTDGTTGGDCKQLVNTGVEYCLRANATCTTAGAGCALLVVHNTDAPLSWVDDTSVPLVVARSLGGFDGNSVKDWMAELATTLVDDYPGIDSNRVFFLGWSAGAGAAHRGMCHTSKGSGQSEYGSNPDLYAAMITLGGCPACSAGWSPSSPMHVLAVNGQEDPFGGGGCEENLREWARDNGCQDPDRAWQNVTEDDLMSGGDGSDIVQKLDFTSCSNGRVIGYRFRDEEHTLSFKKHFDPKVSALEMARQFLTDKRK